MTLLFFNSDSLVSFLNIFNFSIHQSTPLCLFSVTPVQELLLGIIVPAISLLELIVIFGVHWLLWLLAHRDARMGQCFPMRYLASQDTFKKSPYVRTLVAL